MAWLIGIVCIVLVIKFWRIFLPLGLIAGVAIGLILLDAERTDRAQAKLEQQKLEQRKLKVQKVQRALNASPMKDTKWEISSETDPASGKPVPRTASVVSDNGLCRLQVEQRVDRTRLAGIYCDDLLIKDRYSATRVEVKFDNLDKSDSMSVSRFSDGEQSFISSRQSSDNLSYDEFMERLVTANRVALYLEFEDVGKRWISFSLAQADQALMTIGAWKGQSAIPARR